jgi:enamine deaminase RidA (YjgF/YER057c/UK114 family)
MAAGLFLGLLAPGWVLAQDHPKEYPMNTPVPHPTGQAGAEQRLHDHHIQLPPVPTPLGAYVEVVQTGTLLFLSGMLPVADGKPAYLGRLGAELTVEDGRHAAVIACLNAMTAARHHLGSLDRVSRVVRLGVSIATEADFREHPKVADAASDMLVHVFGEEKLSTRSVLGVASLPLGMPIELEVIFEITP